MPVTITELIVVKAPPDVYGVGTYADVTINNPHLLPRRYFLRVDYFVEKVRIATDTFLGFLRGNLEETLHSETSWAADRVKATVGVTSLLIFGDVKETDP